MEVIKINKNNKNDVDNFLQLPLFIYGNSPTIHNSVSKTKSLIESTNLLDLYIVQRMNKKQAPETVGRMAVGFNEQLLDENNVPFGQVGLFEVIEDYDIFSAMLDFAKELLKDKKSILFPMYTSTWYPYRFTSKGDSLFKFFLEAPAKEYYSSFAARYGVTDTFRYKSIICRNIDQVLEKNNKPFKRASEEGITFRRFDKSQAEKEIETIYELSIQAFNDNAFYTSINRDEFANLYKGSINLIDDEFFTIALNSKKEPVGFCFSSLDYSPILEKANIRSFAGKLKFFLNRKKIKGFIIKTVGVIPEYRGKGIQGALTCLHAQTAKQRNYEYIIGALIHSENASPKVLGEPVTEKEYEMYRIKI
ncbi:MAG: hypothetical protein GY754_11415 [bacterium]|nr:hypothetical protein [bacterium]